MSGPSPAATLEEPSPPALLSARRIVHVRGQVLGQVVGTRETLAARLAMVRPFAGVDAQVTRQIGFAAESAAAEQADERPFAGVLAHVQLQVLLGADALAAERTGEAAEWVGSGIRQWSIHSSFHCIE